MSTVTRISLDRIMPWRVSYPPAVKDYMKRLRAGERLRPIHVEKLGPLYRIFDGMHRAQAHVRAGRKTIRAIVIVEVA
jgi:uncharacterized ParB-like nuclease family protein